MCGGEFIGKNIPEPRLCLPRVLPPLPAERHGPDAVNNLSRAALKYQYRAYYPAKTDLAGHADENVQSAGRSFCCRMEDLIELFVNYFSANVFEGFAEAVQSAVAMKTSVYEIMRPAVRIKQFHKPTFPSSTT